LHQLRLRAAHFSARKNENTENLFSTTTIAAIVQNRC